MKGFKFKLDALLKLKEFNEKKIKTELGEILSEIESIKKKMNEIHESIDESYEAQERIMKNPEDAQMLSFFPYYMKNRKEDLKIQHSLLDKWESRREDKLAQLREARGEVKVLDKMKEKKKESFRKEKTKKETLEIEDILNLRRTLKVSEERSS